MAAISSVNAVVPPPVAAVAAAAEPEESLSLRVGKAVAACVQQMAAETELAIQTKDASQAAFYPADFIDVFQSKGSAKAAKVLETTRNNGFLINGYVNPKFFDPVYDELPKRRLLLRPFSFIAKEGVPASTALKAAKVGLRITDCGMQCQIALYEGALEGLGQKRFDKLFSGKDRLNLGFRDDRLQPMRFLCRFTDAAERQSPGKVDHRMVQVGDVVSFNGVKGYNKKHPNGIGANQNAVCIDATLGSQRYVGHGLPSEGVTEEEIAAMLAKEYNKEPDHFSRVPTQNIPSAKKLLQEMGAASFARHKVKEKKPLKAV
jgi:hypothetical protein